MHIQDTSNQFRSDFFSIFLLFFQVKKGLHSALLSFAFISITHYFYNNRNSSNEVNKILLLALRISLCGMEKITLSMQAPARKGKCDCKVHNHSRIHDHDHTTHSSPVYLHYGCACPLVVLCSTGNQLRDPPVLKQCSLNFLVATNRTQWTCFLLTYLQKHCMHMGCSGAQAFQDKISSICRFSDKLLDATCH